LPETGDAIRFSVSSPILSVETKADLVDDSNIGAVKLYGSKLSAGATDKVTFFGADGSASSTTLAKDPDGAWAYTPIKYWEQGATYDFRAVYPSDANVTTASNSDEIVVSGFSIGSSYDLMVAAKTGVSSAAQAGTAVPLEFKHACAAVRFLFQDGDKNYFIKSFSLSGVTTSGTMTYNAANALPTWGSLGTTAYSWAGTSWEVPAAYDETGLEGWYFVVPQDLGDDAKLSFTYTVGSDGTQVIPVTIPLKGGVGVNTSSVTSWARANAYTYKIKIQANAIDLDVKWGAWLGSDEHEYDLFDPVNVAG
jgi:hypothetical protein